MNLGDLFDLDLLQRMLDEGYVRRQTHPESPLAILNYNDGDGSAIATRGSFTSDQAVYATALWKQRYRDVFTPQPGMTYLFEIIYPANRIVVDYKGASDLFLLGAIEIESGCSFGPHESEAFGDWPGPRATVFYYETFADALAAEPRPGAEGIVIRRAFSEDLKVT